MVMAPSAVDPTVGPPHGDQRAGGWIPRWHEVARVFGQTDHPRKHLLPACAWRAGFLALSAAFPAYAENWHVTPTLAVSATLSDNVFLAAGGNRTSDLVTSLTPGISIDGAGARGKLRLSYGLTQNLYARESSANNHQNALNAVGKLEAIEDWLFIDAMGNISQQYLTPLGAVSPSSNVNVNANQTETSTYSLSPYIRGHIFSSMDYMLRYKAGISRSKSGQGDMDTREWQGKLSGNTRWGPLDWAIDASNSTTDYTRGRNLEATRYALTLIYRLNPQWQIWLSNGRESNNYVSQQQESNTTGAYGFVWTPDPRTKLAASKTRRFFGDGYSVELSHRMPRSLWTYSATRDVSFQPSSATSTSVGSNYDAVYSLVAAINPGMAPDAIRAQVIQFLQSRGLPVDGSVVNGYLTNTANLQKRQQFSVALLGARNTVTLTANQTEQEPLGLASGTTGSAVRSDGTRQRGLGISWGHQLTGLSALSLLLNQQQSTTFTTGSPETKTQAAYLFLTTRISPKTSASVGLRRVVGSGVGGYTESALSGGLSHSF